MVELYPRVEEAMPSPEQSQQPEQSFANDIDMGEEILEAAPDQVLVARSQVGEHNLLGYVNVTRISLACRLPVCRQLGKEHNVNLANGNDLHNAYPLVDGPGYAL